MQDQLLCNWNMLLFAVLAQAKANIFNFFK